MFYSQNVDVYFWTCLKTLNFFLLIASIPKWIVLLELPHLLCFFANCSLNCWLLNCSSNFVIYRHDYTWTYGRVKPKPIAPFKPDFVQKDKIILTFDGFFRQRVFEPIAEQYDLIRKVKIMYFMEDDTITVVEPPYIVMECCCIFGFIKMI